MKLNSLKSKFIAGILVITPAFVSIFIIFFIFDKIDKLISPLVVRFIQKYFINIELPHFVITLLSLLFLFLFILFVGIIAENFIGKRIIRLIDKLLSSMPLIKGIYVAMKQLLDAFRLTNSKKFNKVVFVEYPKKDMWVIGFTTSPLCNDISKYFSGKEDEKAVMVNVFIPTTPNPTSGYLIVVNSQDVIETDLSIEEAVKYVVSGGVIQPEKCLSKEV